MSLLVVTGITASAVVIGGARLARPRQSPPGATTLAGLFAPLASTDRVPGISVAVIAAGRPVFAQGFGSSSVERQIPVTPDTQYRLASVSKAFTAVGVFALVESGKIMLDEPARRYCPELSTLNDAPTVRHFLMHRSGMRHTSDSEDTTIKGPVRRLGDALTRVTDEQLRFAPGTRTLYTSWGYAALGCVIEGASNQSYADFMRERVFARAGLMSTTFDEPNYSSPTFSPGFRAGLIGGLRPAAVVDTRFKTPASGLISTVNDMVRFATALLAGRLVARPFVDEMFKVDRDGEGKAGFTAGWTPKGVTPEGRVFDYNGSMEGATAFLEVVPEHNYALALLANRERYVPDLQPFVNEARRLVLATGKNTAVPGN